MATRFARSTHAPGKSQLIDNTVFSAGVPASGIGKLTRSMAVGKSGRGNAYPNATAKAAAEPSGRDYDRLFTGDENGKAIVQFAKLYALDIATQIVNHFANTPTAFQSNFDVATEAIILKDVNGLPSVDDAWKTRYGGHTIRIRVRGMFVEMSKPQAFLITMTIEGLVNDQGAQDFKPILNEIVGLVPLRRAAEPAIVPPAEERQQPAIGTDEAERAG